MKASLLAISISSVLAAPAFASAPQVDVELANQQTLQLIDGQMNAIDASVQYKLNEQYANATPGTTATVDDVTYEKQSNGTWAAVGAASAALVAGLLSSSSSSGSSDNGNTIPELPVTTSMDSVGTWKVADNDSGYIVTLAGQEVYVDSSNVTLNNDGTATIVVNDRKLIVGINGDELYRVDQVSRPDLDIPTYMPQLSDPEYGNGIVGQGWVKVDVGAGDTNYHKFEKVTDEGVKTIEVVDQRSNGNGVDIRVGGGDWRNFDGSKIEAAQDFIDEHFRPADMPQLSDPEYGNGIVGQGWVKVDVGAGDTNYHKFEKVTDEGVKTIEVVDQRSNGNGVDIRVGGGDWRNFDGSKIEAAQDFIDEHFRPADMPQLSDPEYGNGIVGQGWVKVDVGAGDTNYHKFEKVTDEGVKTIEVVDQRSNGNGVDIRVGDGDWRNFDGSKIEAAQDFIDEHFRPADMPQLSDPEYGNGIVGQGWVKVDVGAGDTNYHKFEKVTDEGVKTIEVVDQRSNGNGVDIRVGDGDWRNFDGSKIEAAQDFIDEHFRPADMPQLSDPEYGNGIVGQGWVKVDVGAGDTNYHKFEKVTDEGVKTIEVVDQRSNGNGVDIRVGDGDWRNFDGSKIEAAQDFIDEHFRPADMPQLSDPEYGNGIVGQGWVKVDVGAGDTNYHKFEKVTDEGVKTIEVVDQRSSGNGVDIRVGGGDWKQFDGSKIAAAKDFIDEHLKPADMPQIDAPAKPTISAGLEGDNIVITVNGKSQTTDFTAEADDRGNVHIKDRHGNIVGEGYIDEVNGTVTFGNGIVINDRGDVTLPPAVKNNVKDRVQSIDPTKLQKAKSAIQQRLRS